MRFRRRASKCSYLLGNGSPQTAPTFSVAPHHPTSSVFAIPAAQLQPLWIKRCARRKSQRPLGGSPCQGQMRTRTGLGKEYFVSGWEGYNVLNDVRRTVLRIL